MEFRPYRRRFRRPLRAAWGEWRVRQGVLVKVTTPEGGVGFGEVAPLPGKEEGEVRTACRFFDSLRGVWEAEAGMGRANDPPLCRYALESALAHASASSAQHEFTVAALLPAGEDVLEGLDSRFAEGFRVFKWKIGAGPPDWEREIFEELLRRARGLGGGVRFRLDANGALDRAAAERWLERLDPDDVEFLEQPLAVGQEQRTLSMARGFSVPVALDESVTSLDEFERFQAEWPGLFVVKPSWLGRWPEGGVVARGGRERLIFSSALETSIGIENALRLAAASGGGLFAVGFGVASFFERDGFFLHRAGPRITCGELPPSSFEAVWERAEGVRA